MVTASLSMTTTVVSYTTVTSSFLHVGRNLRKRWAVKSRVTILYSNGQDERRSMRTARLCQEGRETFHRTHRKLKQTEKGIFLF